MLPKRMVALSVRQPWAWLIVNGHKDVENRTWPTRLRGRVLVHAGAVMTRDDYTSCCLFTADIRKERCLPRYDLLKAQCGGVVGQIEIVDCVTESSSAWFVGPYGFVLRNPKILPFYKCKGSLGFFQLAMPAIGTLARK